MIRINLLPHREARRKRNKIAFVRLLVLAGILGGTFVLLVGIFIASKISEQDARNAYIKAENAKLDEQIKEIATIKQEIEALKARQQAVEDLQSDRNQPVYLLDELTKQVPEGVYLRNFKQEGQKVSLNGFAQSNERVSELLHNVGNNSPWLEKPELIEIKAGSIGQGRDAKKVYEFTMNVGIKRPRDQGKAAPGGAGSTDKTAGDKTAPVTAVGGATAAAGAAGKASAAPDMPKKP